MTALTYEGSSCDFEDGFLQGRQSNINSECGNVWGYEGSTGNEICRTVEGGERVEVPLHLSAMTGKDLGEEIRIDCELTLTNSLGESSKEFGQNIQVDYTQWMQEALDPISIKMPEIAGLATLKLKVSDDQGNVLNRNFMHFEIQSDQVPAGVEVLSVSASEFSQAEWSQKQWNVLDGKKVNWR